MHPANRAALRSTTSRVFAMSTAMPGRPIVANVLCGLLNLDTVIVCHCSGHGQRVLYTLSVAVVEHSIPKVSEDKDQDKTVFQGCGVLVDKSRAVELPAGPVVRLAGLLLHFATEGFDVSRRLARAPTKIAQHSMLVHFHSRSAFCSS